MIHSVPVHTGATEPRAVHRMRYVIYLTLLPNETQKIREAYEAWGGK